MKNDVYTGGLHADAGNHIPSSVFFFSPRVFLSFVTSVSEAGCFTGCDEGGGGGGAGGGVQLCARCSVNSLTGF